MIDSSIGSGPAGPTPTAPLVVSVRSEGQSSGVIEVRGELDVATVSTLRKRLEPLNGRGGDNAFDRIVYLLPELTFMDSTGLHCILTAVAGHGPDTIGIREPSPQVRRLLELVGLDSLIEPAAPR